jgi:signal transduction histidine kinase
VSTGDQQLDVWERRERIALAVIPYISLTLATALALLVEHDSWSHILAVLGLTGVTLAWVAGMVTLHPALRDRPRMAVAYFVGLILLLAGLIALSSMYGFGVITGYTHAFLLPRRLRIPGVIAVATLAAVAQMGGFGPAAALPAVYLLVLAINAFLAGGLCYFLWRQDEESDRRKSMIEELAETNARLEATMEENAGLHAQLLTQAREAGVLDERQRMAGEIHDTIAQGLAGVVTQLQAAKQARDRDADWERHVNLAQEMAREGLSEARRSVQALRPGQLEEAGLPDALAEVVERWTSVHRVPVEVSTTGTVRPMHPEVEGTLLRTAQEALANVAKHAGASRVALTLSYMGDVVTLDVRDDGAGFAPGEVRANGDGGYGLTAMRRRVARVAGTLEIESEPGSGTAISASVPAVPAGGAA